MINEGSYEQQRALVQAELRKLQIKPVSFEVFAKSAAEKDQIKECKIQHKAFLRKQGKDPKKDLN